MKIFFTVLIAAFTNILSKTKVSLMH